MTADRGRPSGGQGARGGARGAPKQGAGRGAAKSRGDSAPRREGGRPARPAAGKPPRSAGGKPERREAAGKAARRDPSGKPERREAGAKPARRDAAAGPGGGFGRPQRSRPAGPAKIRPPVGTAKGRPAVKSGESRDKGEAATPTVRKVAVGANEAGQRIDNFLIKRMPGVPKSHIYRLLRSGQVRVGGGRVKAERKLLQGEEVRIPPVRIADRNEPVRAPDAVLNKLRESIVYEDAHYLAISKPAGLASHGGTGVAYGVIEAARGWAKHDFLELAHRLDRDTSGVLLLAKSRPALLRAQRAFRDGLSDKRYFALLVGRLQGGAREVDAALVKSRLEGGERFVEVDDEEGKPSRSRFVPQAHYRDATLCEVEIFSGRTHQIRVHALALGHPVAGDRKYGLRDEQKTLRDKGLRRMFLHSHFLQLPKDGEFPKLTLSAPMTDELREFLDDLGPGR